VTEDYAGWAALAALAVVLLLAWLIAWSATRGADPRAAGNRGRIFRRRPHRDAFRPEGAREQPPRRRAAVIVNPTKFDDVAAVRRQITRRCAELGWDEPLFLETTREDPGTGQAREALEQRAAVVCALGGDGTVRAVAAGLTGSDTPMGLLPSGTGNLLARNLGLPVDSLDDALRVALRGQNKRIDVGRLTIDQSGHHGRPDERIFLVMAGIGFDALVMADAPEELKARVGWPAYVLSGARNLRGPQFRVRVKIDDGEEFTRRTRTVVIGNCGRLLGGLVLMPEADIADGKLDAVVISPKGVVGWAAVAARVFSRRRRGHQRVEHHTGATVRIRADRQQPLQLDGDPIGTALTVTAEVLPLSLVLRVGGPA
jgi:diacylglycerol kinase (ATP)